ALVFRTIARPDDRDFSVVEYPFNWDAQLDIKKLRIGYLEDAFNEKERNPELKANDDAVLAQLRALGLTLTPFKLPDFPMMRMASGALGVESAAAFDEYARKSTDANLTTGNRAVGWRRGHFIPAVEYLQSQRVRGLVMEQFANATANFDVWVAPYIDMRRLPASPPAAGTTPAAPTTAPASPPPPPGPIMSHFTVA